LGNLERGLFTDDCEKKGGLRKQRASLYGSSVGGTWRNGYFTGDPEEYVKEGCGNGHLSPQGPHW